MLATLSQSPKTAMSLEPQKLTVAQTRSNRIPNKELRAREYWGLRRSGTENRVKVRYRLDCETLMAATVVRGADPEGIGYRLTIKF
jgi:hypothetical protein